MTWKSLSEEKLRLFARYFSLNILSHIHLWFQEVERHLGLETAMSIQERVWERWYPILKKRLGSLIQSPEDVDELNKETLIELLTSLAKSWLAADGVWFQEVEKKEGMFTAKSCNDLAWRRFTVIEAKRIMKALEIPEESSLDGLEKALSFRMYTLINKYRMEKKKDALEFYMVECRVQIARKRKGLPDYPCKSGGMVEYTYFAKAVDPRIKTTCIACPPDDHPEDWWCAWRFELS